MTNREFAEEIVDKVLIELSGRAGIGNALENVDSEVYDELEEALILIVQSELEPLISKHA